MDASDLYGECDDSEADTNFDSGDEDQPSVAGERAPVSKKAKVKLVCGSTDTRPLILLS